LECYFKGKNMAGCFHFHFALKTLSKREKVVATGVQGPAGPLRSVSARLAPRATTPTRDFSSLPDSFGVITYALALHDNDLTVLLV
jgi:hypothetical protein